MSKRKFEDNDLVFSIAQLVIAWDIVSHQYSKLSLEQKRKLIVSLEKAKRLKVSKE